MHLQYSIPLDIICEWELIALLDEEHSVKLETLLSLVLPGVSNLTHSLINK